MAVREEMRRMGLVVQYAPDECRLYPIFKMGKVGIHQN